MEISKTDVEHIASLARLELTEEEKRIFQEQLSSIIEYVDKLNEVNVGNVEPMSHVHASTNVLRSDDRTSSIHVEEALSNSFKSLL